MRSKRGLLASLGAATCLILAGTFALASVSTVIAFRGWPGVQTSKAYSPPTLLAAATVDGGSSTSHHKAAAIVVPDPAPALHKVKATSSHHKASAHNTVAATPVQAAGTSNLTPAKTTDSTGDQKPAPTHTERKKTPLAKTVSDVGDGLDKTVSGTGKVLGGAVAPVSPGLGSLVENATNAVGGIVKSATDALAAILDLLKPPQ